MNENNYISQEEIDNRVSFCMVCENNVLIEVPKCLQCNCTISVITTLPLKTCPIGKW